VPKGVLLAAALAIGVSLILHFTVFGRYVFALGSNERTARLCGIRIPQVKVAVYTLAGLFVGVAGMYHFATIRVANPIEGVGLELQVIAAVVIGGGSLSGGRGSVIGALTGAAIMSVIRSGCDQLPGIEQPHQEIIIGMVIIVAVAVDQLRHRGAGAD
jgi:ribose/xylose/arabinose/galactoside ABC-type transport system permease subunit